MTVASWNAMHARIPLVILAVLVLMPNVVSASGVVPISPFSYGAQTTYRFAQTHAYAYTTTTKSVQNVTLSTFVGSPCPPLALCARSSYENVTLLANTTLTSNSTWINQTVTCNQYIPCNAMPTLLCDGTYYHHSLSIVYLPRACLHLSLLFNGTTLGCNFVGCQTPSFNVTRILSYTTYSVASRWVSLAGLYYLFANLSLSPRITGREVVFAPSNVTIVANLPANPARNLSITDLNTSLPIYGATLATGYAILGLSAVTDTFYEFAETPFISTTGSGQNATYPDTIVLIVTNVSQPTPGTYLATASWTDSRNYSFSGQFLLEASLFANAAIASVSANGMELKGGSWHSTSNEVTIYPGAVTVPGNASVAFAVSYTLSANQCIFTCTLAIVDGVPISLPLVILGVIIVAIALVGYVVKRGSRGETIFAVLAFVAIIAAAVYLPQGVS